MVSHCVLLETVAKTRISSARDVDMSGARNTAQDVNVPHFEEKNPTDHA